MVRTTCVVGKPKTGESGATASGMTSRSILVDSVSRARPRSLRKWLCSITKLSSNAKEAAEKIDGESLAPEVSARTAEITVWDESPEDAGWRVHGRPLENQVSIAEQLVSEGNEQAAREQRMAAGAPGILRN